MFQTNYLADGPTDPTIAMFGYMILDERQNLTALLTIDIQGHKYVLLLTPILRESVTVLVELEPVGNERQTYLRNPFLLCPEARFEKI